MAFEDNDLQEQLAQAPPQAPTAADADAAKANAESMAAQSLARAASGHTDLDIASAIDKSRPQGILPNKEDVTAPDLGPAPGSVGFHLMNALSTPAAKEPGGAVKALFSGVTDALLHGRAPLPGSWQSAISNADASKPTTPPPAGPSRAQRIISNLGASFGDVAAATEGGPEGGGIMGAARVARAGAVRSREEMNERRQMAVSNAQMLHEQSLVHKMGEDEINASIAASKSQMENITTAVPGAPPDASGTVVAKDKTSDELNAMLQPAVPGGKAELDPAEQTVFATGRVLTGKDANGIPQYRTTYTVIKPAKEVELTPENAKYLNENLGLTGSEAYSTDPEKPQRLPGVQVNDLFQKANSARITKRAFEVKEAGDDKIIRENQTSKDAERIYQNPIVLNARNGHDVSTEGHPDPFAVVKTYDYMMNHPELVAKTGIQNFSEAYIKAAGGTAVWDKKVEEYSKAQAKNQDTVDQMLDKATSDPKEIEGHTPAYEAAMKSIIADPSASVEKKKKAADVLAVTKDVQQGEIDLEKAKAEGKKEAAVGYQGDENASTPEAYLSSLKPNEQAIVSLIRTGRAATTRMEYLLARQPEVMAAVERAFPGEFDSSKVQKYIETSKDFAAKKVADQMLSGGAVLQHLQEARELNTNASHVPGTPAYNAYKNKIDTLAGELGKFYGDATVPAIEGYKSTLMATLPGNRESAILTQAKSMTDRLTGYVTRWKNAAPSKVYEAKMPWISPEAQHAISKLNPQFVQDYPDLVSGAASTPQAIRERQAVAPSQFQGKIGVEVGGKTHYFNTQAEADNFKKLAGIQ